MLRVRYYKDGAVKFFVCPECTSEMKFSKNGKKKPQPTRKPIGDNAKVHITSLNPHFPHQEPQHKILRVRKSGAKDSASL